MATRAATFTAKIRNLKDYHYRMANNMSTQPSGVDVANTLKYFEQTLLSVLKDVPLIPQESYAPRQADSLRLSVFPNLNYSGLHEAVINMIDVMPGVQYGQHALGQAILTVLGCIISFLEYEVVDQLPIKVASTLATFPASLQDETINLLCTNLLPITLGYEGMNDNPTYATDSSAAIIMLVLQYVENPAFHSQIIECIMSMKKNVCKDLLSVIAYGPPQARAPAVHHLFHNWPQLNPSLSDTRIQHYDYTPWEVTLCQKESCPNHGNSKAVKMCLDPAISIECGDRPPPIFICADCVDLCRRDHIKFLVDVLKPMENVAIKCENKNCHSVHNQGVCTCFSIECTSLNRFKPTRYCQTCHEVKHINDKSGKNHIFHVTIPDIWSCSSELQGYLMEAIVSLMREVSPLEDKRTVEMGEERAPRHGLAMENDDEKEEGDAEEERKLLSRYGIWLLVERCKPKADIPIEVLGRLIAMLFQWFDATAYLPDDNVGNALERLKPQYVCKWLQEVAKTHLEVILSCLLPHPVEYARVGGHWDTLSSRTSQIKEGLNRLCCLIPYDVVSFEVWDYVMPFWLEAIRTEVPEEERQDLKVLLRKVFDTDMSPLPFSIDKMYHFVSERFDNTTALVQEQNLSWLQILTSLEIIVPLNLMVDMFKMGVASLCSPPNQSDLQGPDLQTSAPANVPLDSFPLGSPLSPTGSANKKEQCTVFNFDFMTQDLDVKNVTCFAMMLDLVLAQADLQEAAANHGVHEEINKDIMSLVSRVLETPWEGTHTCLEDEEEGNHQETIIDCALCEVSSQLFEISSQVMQFVAPKEELKLPQKDLPKVEEMNASKSSGIGPLGCGEAEQAMLEEFDVSNLSNHTQLLHSLLICIDEQCDADALFFLLKAVKLLVLHAECLHGVDQNYLKYSLRRYMMPNLWKLLQSEYCQLGVMAVPLLLYCITLPNGPDIFWHMVEDDFNNEEWRARFSAVEKVTVLVRLLDPESVERNQQIMTSLAHAFCCLISSINDINSAVVQRATTYLQTINHANIKCMCRCLEFQFDSVIKDRTMILQKMYLISVVLQNQDIFTWEFFLNRFDSLCLEAQLDLESTGDVASLQDLQSTDRNSDTFLRKINRARFALARTDSIRSVSYSVYAKVPYRRAASVPMHLLTKTLPKSVQMKEKDKSPYTRQQSAPQFHRGSRFGMGMFSNYMFPGGNLREFTDEESNFANLLQRAMDLEGVDRETIHQLVSLLMKFMVCVDQDCVNEDRNMSRAQNIVLRHLNVLLGYNQTEKAFSVPPYKLRYSAVFNAYITLLPSVLDKNFALGNIILPVSMALLQYCPSPQRYASDYQPPNYTLWLLDPHTRQAWLSALLVILYKYQYSTAPACSIIQNLVKLCVNTVAAQLHSCKSPDDTFGPASPMVPRTRDLSTVSVGDLDDILETDTPPASPRPPSFTTTDTVTINMTSPSNTTVHYKKPESVKTEETDVDSLSPTSKVCSPTWRGGSPPRPSSPTSGRPMSPPQSGRTMSPPLTALSPPTSPPPFDTTTDPAAVVLAQRRHQPRRIAEYHRNSWCEDDEVTSDGGTHSDTTTGSSTAPSKPPMLRQQTEPILKYNPFQQRTLEQSVEQYVLEQVHRSHSSSPIHTGKKPKDPKDVDAKIAEQILAFESQGKTTNTVDSESNDPPMPVKPLPKSNSLDMNFDKVGNLPGFDKKFEPVGKAIPHVLEDVKETDEEWESPKKTSATEEAGTSDERHEQTDSDLDESPDPSTSPQEEPKLKPQYRQRKARKTGLTTVELQKMIPELGDFSSDKKSPTSTRSRRTELLSKSAPSLPKKSINVLRMNEQVLMERCAECGVVLEQYDEETIGLAIVCLATFIHREPALAAPLLLDMLQAVARVAASHPYPWQTDISGVVIPGNSVSAARQFLRCSIHQLAPNSVLPQLFLSQLDEPTDFLRTLASSLADFTELSSHMALQLLLEGVNDMETIGPEPLQNLLYNIAIYLDCIPLETSGPTWSSILPQFETFFRRIPGSLQPPCDMIPILKIMIAVLKVPGITSVKGILEPFSKLVSMTVQHCKFKLQLILDISCLCGRAFTKDRDKLYLCRTVIYELVQALKFKSQLPDDNLILLLQFVLVDAGGTVGAISFVEELSSYTFNPHSQSLISSNAADCMKQHLSECVEFVADIHTINKIKSHITGGGSDNLNEDTLGSVLKAAIAQYVALEFTRGNGPRDNRTITRYLPWLYHPPSAMQQGPREFIDCVGHIRLLSWLLLGSLNHLAITGCRGHIVCQPLPLEASTYMSDHIMVIMSGFAEQSKASVLHMSSLFHAFILCQLWTLYCECYAPHTDSVDSYNNAHATIMDFWARVTPGILQLLSHSQVLAEMVNLHFLSLIEALQECNSTVLHKLFPMWTAILFSYHSQLPGHMQVRLQMSQNWEPKEERVETTQVDPQILITWLKRLQFKLGQIEVQSSQATQFYSV